MIAHCLILLLASFVAVGAAAAERRTIYRCTLDGVTTFSDRPCGDSVQVHSLENLAETVTAVTSPGSRPAPAARAPSAQPSTRRATAGHQKDVHAKECLRLDATLRGLAARMRAGYTAAEGERLREQQRTLRERRRELHCR